MFYIFRLIAATPAALPSHTATRQIVKESAARPYAKKYFGRG